MTNEQIKKIALACGFKLKEQPTGEMDLNPYVYDFARELIKQNQQSAWVNVKDALPTEGEVVLAWTGYNFDVTETISFHDEDGNLGVGLENDYATHWQLLPQPPKASE